jgi:hypothetical protein
MRILFQIARRPSGGRVAISKHLLAFLVERAMTLLAQIERS